MPTYYWFRDFTISCVAENGVVRYQASLEANDGSRRQIAGTVPAAQWESFRKDLDVFGLEGLRSNRLLGTSTTDCPFYRFALRDSTRDFDFRWYGGEEVEGGVRAAFVTRMERNFPGRILREMEQASGR